MTHSDREEVEPDEAIYTAYGSVMHFVQSWELALALLWWRSSLSASDRREAESRASKRAVIRLQTAFDRITASQARRELEDNMPPPLLELVGELLPDRNRLAHKFLREQQTAGGFKPGTMLWLTGAGLRFERSLHALFEHMAAFDPYDGVVRPHWPDLASGLAEKLFAGEPFDFEAELRRVHGESETE